MKWNKKKCSKKCNFTKLHASGFIMKWRSNKNIPYTCKKRDQTIYTQQTTVAVSRQKGQEPLCVQDLLGLLRIFISACESKQIIKHNVSILLTSQSHLSHTTHSTQEAAEGRTAHNNCNGENGKVSNTETMCLRSSILLHSSHYYEPVLPNKEPPTSCDNGVFIILYFCVLVTCSEQ